VPRCCRSAPDKSSSTLHRAASCGRSGHILLVTADGLAVVEVRDLRVRAIAADRQERRRFWTRWLHELVWEAQEDAPQAVSSPQAAEPGTWLVLGDAGGLADALAAPLTSAGQELVVARPGTVLRRLGPDRFELRPPVRGVLHLWSHEAAQRDLTTGKLSWPTSAGPLSVIHLAQALDAAGLAWPLTIVPVGAQPVDGRIGLGGLLQSPLWGMGRVLHHESLSLQTRMIDLDPDTALEDVGALARELLGATSDEDQVAWRGSKRLVARLQPSKRESGSLPLAMRPDASYLITGGLGALGLVFARWLAVRGARRIVLIGRSQPPPRDSWRSLAADHPAGHR
jgi:myxalamid-type polyketide synthase MxaC